MTVFLTINGWELPIHDGQFQEGTDEGGSRSRVFSGKLSMNRRFVKRNYQGETVLLAADEAAAVRGLVLGLGNTWDFNRDATDLFSYRGHGLEPGYQCANSAGSGFEGTRGLLMTSGGYFRIASVTRDILWTHEWTLICHADTFSGAFERILFRDNDPPGEAWIDGIYNASATVNNIIDTSNVSSNGFVFYGKRRDTGANAAAKYDNITILPYRVTDEMAAVFSANANVFSSLPHVLVRTGLQDSQFSDELSMLGDVTDTDYVQANVEGGGFAMDNERLSFLFEESESVDIIDPPVDVGGHAFMYSPVKGSEGVLDPDGAAVADPVTTWDNCVYGAFDADDNLLWSSYAASVTSPSPPFGTNHVTGWFCYQANNGDVIVAVRCTGDINILDTDRSTILATTALGYTTVNDTQVPIIIWRQNASGLVWGPYEIKVESSYNSASLMNLIPHHWVVGPNEEYLVCNFDHYGEPLSGTTRNWGYGTPGWTVGGSPAPLAYYTQITPSVGNGFENLSGTVVINPTTGQPLKVTMHMESDPSYTSGTNEAHNASGDGNDWLKATTINGHPTVWAERFRYSSNLTNRPESERPFFDANGARIRIPCPKSNTQRSWMVAKWDVADNYEVQWVVRSPDGQLDPLGDFPETAGTSKDSEGGLAVVDANGVSYHWDHFPAVTSWSDVPGYYKRERAPTDYSARWSLFVENNVTNRYQGVLYALDADGEILWQRRAAGAGSSIGVFNAGGMQLSPDGTKIYMLFNMYASQNETIVLDRGGPQQYVSNAQQWYGVHIWASYDVSNGDLLAYNHSDDIIGGGTMIDVDKEYHGTMTLRPVSGQICFNHIGDGFDILWTTRLGTETNPAPLELGTRSPGPAFPSSEAGQMHRVEIDPTTMIATKAFRWWAGPNPPIYGIMSAR